MTKQTTIFYNEMSRDNLERVKLYKETLIKQLVTDIYDRDFVIRDLYELVTLEEKLREGIKNMENKIDIENTEDEINGKN